MKIYITLQNWPTYHVLLCLRSTDSRLACETEGGKFAVPQACVSRSSMLFLLMDAFDTLHCMSSIEPLLHTLAAQVD